MKVTTKSLLENFPPLDKWVCSNFTSGGHVIDYPYHELLREHLVFPNYKREIRIDIMTWKGTSIGAKHFYPSVKLSPIRFLEGKGLVDCWDDPALYQRTDLEPDTQYNKITFPDHVKNKIITAKKTGFEFTYDEKKDRGFTDPRRAMEWILYIISKFLPPEKYKMDEYNVSNTITSYEEECRIEGLEHKDYKPLLANWIEKEQKT